jgi:hypothetical protein
MKIIRTQERKGKPPLVTIELDSSDEVLVGFSKRAHYKLGYPNETVVPVERIQEAQHVIWDDIEQQWIT